MRTAVVQHVVDVTAGISAILKTCKIIFFLQIRSITSLIHIPISFIQGMIVSYKYL